MVVLFCFVRSFGFIGYCRLLTPEHTMVETHPPEVPDLRLQNPWPELQARQFGRLIFCTMR